MHASGAPTSRHSGPSRQRRIGGRGCESRCAGQRRFATRRHQDRAGRWPDPTQYRRDARRTRRIDGLAAAHDLRGAHGLRRRGYAVSIDRSDKTRGSTYRIAADAGFDDAAAAAVEPATWQSASSIAGDQTRCRPASAQGGLMPAQRRARDGGRHRLNRPLLANVDVPAAIIAGPAIATPSSFAFNGGTVWAGRRPPICRAGCCCACSLTGCRPRRSATSTRRPCVFFASRPGRAAATPDGLPVRDARAGKTRRRGRTRRPGALLVREWSGRPERVMVLEKGFVVEWRDLPQPFVRAPRR